MGDTADQLRNDIDQGRTRDKVRAFDPAAAPLGTDDEAAGTPPTAERIAMARQAERSREHRPGFAADPGDRARPYGTAAVLLACCLIIGALLWWLVA